MLTGAWLSTAAGSAWPWLARAAAGGDAGCNTGCIDTHALAIVDSTLTCGASFAHYAAQLQLPIFEAGDDIGALWFTTLTPLVGDRAAARAAPSLIGFTRPADYFILRHLAMRGARYTEHSHEQRESSHTQPAYVAFALTPSATHRV